MNHLLTFEDFIAESLISVKRKYTDKYPTQRIYTAAPIREKILSFVKENGTVTHAELIEFINSMNEKNGGATSRKWINKNTQYFKIKETKGEKNYSLSSLGNRVHSAILKQVS